MPHTVGLESASGEPVALKSVAMEGRLDGLFLRMTITQEYRNETGKNLEIVYTFPLAFGATLMGMDVTLGDKTLQACVVEKQEATERYEKAIDEGDTPVMVEASSDGLYTANLGNILDGESLKLSIRYAQLLNFEQGRVRLHVPTVIAPRYGDAHAEGGLALHESDAVDLLAEYALDARIDLAGDIARGKVSSPSHAVETRATEDGLAVILRPGATLDRDFVLTVADLPGASFAVVAPDHDAQVVLATFCPELPEHAAPVALKILVDCSGSMQGDSMTQARTALTGILGQLDERDYVSYSRFGSEYRHVFSALTPYGEKAQLALSRAVRTTQADMGGTEMEAALLSTLQDITAPEAAPPVNVLLITDGEVWNIDGVLKAALDEGQRLFIVGVSNSPAESLLRKLAEASGGACELVSPNEDMAAAITRVFYRMRGARAGSPRIDWSNEPNNEPLWQSPLPKAIYGKETLHVFARFARAPTAAPQLCWEADGETGNAQAGCLDAVDDPELARLGGARQMQMASPEEALDLAKKYQLVSSQTNLFLVHVREGEKAVDLPVLHQVPQMMAAGWGGLGSACQFKMSSPAIIRNRQVSPSVLLDNVDRHGAPPVLCELYEDNYPLYEDNFEEENSTVLLSRQTSQDLVEALNAAARTETEWEMALSTILAQAIEALREWMIELAAREGLTSGTVWAIALEWLASDQGIELSRQAKRLLRVQLQGVDAKEKKAVIQALAMLVCDGA